MSSGTQQHQSGRIFLWSASSCLFLTPSCSNGRRRTRLSTLRLPSWELTSLPLNSSTRTCRRRLRRPELLAIITLFTVNFSINLVKKELQARHTYVISVSIKPLDLAFHSTTKIFFHYVVILWLVKETKNLSRWSISYLLAETISGCWPDAEIPRLASSQGWDNMQSLAKS